MRFVFAMVGLMLGTVASAQDLEPAWLVEDASSTRFESAPTPGPEFEKGLRVFVLAREGDKVRVFVGDRFGWLAADKLTDEGPALTPPPVQFKLPVGDGE